MDISSLLKATDEDDVQSTNSPASVSRSESVPSSVATSVAPLPPPQPRSAVPAKRLSSSQDHPIQSPAKKQSKWSPEEDARIIQLRQDGMKWEDISKHLPGRSAISCRLHYQNYLERRSEWDEDRKNKLARLYERYVEKRCTRSSLSQSSDVKILYHGPACHLLFSEWPVSLADFFFAQQGFEPTCGPELQKRWPCRGELLRPCIGRWVSTKWQSVPA